MEPLHKLALSVVTRLADYFVSHLTKVDPNFIMAIAGLTAIGTGCWLMPPSYNMIVPVVCLLAEAILVARWWNAKGPNRSKAAKEASDVAIMAFLAACLGLCTVCVLRQDFLSSLFWLSLGGAVFGLPYAAVFHKHGKAEVEDFVQRASAVKKKRTTKKSAAA